MLILILFIAFVFQPISPCPADTVTNNAVSSSIPMDTRVHWMREANKISTSNGVCPFFAFAAVIVNHTSTGLGELVCSGINQQSLSGNPTDHGEMVAIDNCNQLFTAKNGRYRLSANDAFAAFQHLSIYTNGESCPMCASAIRWAGFKEYIYGTSIAKLVQEGWGQIKIASREIFSASGDLRPNTIYVGAVLNNETDPFFSWQYNNRNPCPVGCRRTGSDNICRAN